MVRSYQELHLLLVEDNSGDFVLIKDYLEDEITNPVIHHAKTFAGAKNILQNNLRLDVILLDLSLPDLSGEELVNSVINISGSIPVIVLTGFSDKAFGIKTISMGVSDYLLKDNLTAAELLKSITYSRERKSITAELEKSEVNYRNLFQASSLPMWVFDPSTYKFLSVNTAAVRHYGYSLEEFLQLTIKEIRPKEEIEGLEKTVRSNEISGSSFEGKFKHLKKNGELIYVEIKSNIIDFDGIKARLVVANDVSEKIKAEDALRLSEKRFKALVQEGSDLISISDIDGNYSYVSPTTEPIISFSTEEFIGHNAFDYIHEDDQARVLADLNLLKVQKRVHILPYRFRWADGSYHWMETIATNLLDEPSVKGIVANSKDVSERYIYEEKLRKQEALFRAIIEKSSEMKTLITKDGEIIFGTPSITKILGYSPEEYLGMNEREIVHPDDIEQFFSKINSMVLQKRNFMHIQLRIRNKQGYYRWCDKTITNLLDDPDVNAIVCNFVDVTEKKIAELKIKESYDRYNLVSKATSDAIWDYDFAEDATFIAGNGYKNLFGYPIVNSFAGNLFWESCLHPEDKSEVLQKLKLFIDDETQTQFSYQYRFLKADKTYAYVNDRIFIIRENGIPIRLIGALNDITRQKEEELRLKLLESVITNATDAVMITDAFPIDEPGPTILYVNEAFSRMTGYIKEEIIGKTPRIFQGVNSNREELQRIRTAMRNKESCKVEVINYTKKGDEYWVEIAMSPIADSAGEVSHFIAIERDITERKNQQWEKEKLINELSENNKDLLQFSYITSHNLRGPIANLLGLTSLLGNYKIKDPTLKLIFDGIIKATNNFDETIKDLSTVLNVRDRPSIPREGIALQTIYEKVLNQCEPLVKESDAKIKVVFDQAPTINFNKAYAESIILNLLTNAIKYRSPKRKLEIFITSENLSNEVVLKFKDNGLGIDLDLCGERLFSLYQRFHTHIDGKGLGLFLIRSQMEILGGSIDVESKLDQGTTFILKFKKSGSQ